MANYTTDMDPAVWIESYDLAMDLLRATDGVRARYFTMMLEGSARRWFKNLPENYVTPWMNLKEKFIKNFQGTCKRATQIVDLEHYVHKEGESTLSWEWRASDIIHSSDTITSQTVVIVLERNCKFEPLVHKLGRLKRTVKDMGELMNAVIKYVESNQTKDAESEEDKAGQNNKTVAEDPRMKTNRTDGDLIRMLLT